MEIISIFGGSQPKQGSQAYIEAYELGKLLASGGYTVLTGGYIGTMEAASKGASDAGGHVIGVTCDEIERWRPIKPNPWVKEEWRRETLIERLQTLVQTCKAAIALPGGPGTLTEIALTWNLMIISAVTPKPIILIGEGWQAVFDQFLRSFDGYIPDNQRGYIKFVPDVITAFEMLKKFI